jgi:death-associated protein kinase
MTFLNICRKASASFPVLSWPQFKEMVRSQINPLASDEHLQELIQQLQVMGEILYLKGKAENSQDLIILNPRWLTVEVIGYLLSYEFICKSRITGTYSVDDIQTEFPETDAFDLLQVLESISVCAQIDYEGDIAYEFPCFTLKEAFDDVWDKNNIRYSNAVYCGLRIQCEKHVPSGQLLLCLIPRLQISLRHSIKGHPDYDVCELYHWFKGSKLSIGPIEAILTANPINEAIEIKVRGPVEMRTDCFLFMEDLLNILETTLFEICPGFIFEKHYLSPLQLREHKDHISSYSSYSILKTLLTDENELVLHQKVKSTDSLREEMIADIISFGIDDLSSIVRAAKFRSIQTPFSSFSPSLMSSPSFNPSDGGPTLVSNLHSSNLSLLTKQRLCSVLDPPEPIGRDWCMLGILLGINNILISNYYYYFF